ncbi:hypothetical protein SCB49_02854 [unidentified eubacterium SCB49]|nr:hypothetical protein SCB49_02854 [unidentified eubacterium SCB49]
MKIVKATLLLALSLTLSFCGNDKKSSNSETDGALEVVEVDTVEETVYPESTLTAKFKDEKIGVAYKAYSKLQNALVNTNAKDAGVAAIALNEAMGVVGADDAVLVAVKNVAETTDIEVQRKEFVVITAAMEKMLANSMDSGMVYKVYCPMAFNNTGGYWLSSDKQVQNPYFGDKMMRCGRVDSAIQ